MGITSGPICCLSRLTWNVECNLQLSGSNSFYEVGIELHRTHNAASDFFEYREKCLSNVGSLSRPYLQHRILFSSLVGKVLHHCALRRLSLMGIPLA